MCFTGPILRDDMLQWTLAPLLYLMWGFWPVSLSLACLSREQQEGLEPFSLMLLEAVDK